MGSWVDSPEAETVRRVLVGARQAQGLTQRDLAARIGKSPTFVAQVELGQRRVDVLQFIAITRAIGIDSAEAFARVASAIQGQPSI
jgi:transcriptional regulator with XRE-family HTH domain